MGQEMALAYIGRLTVNHKFGLALLFISALAYSGSGFAFSFSTGPSFKTAPYELGEVPPPSVTLNVILDPEEVVSFELKKFEHFQNGILHQSLPIDPSFNAAGSHPYTFSATPAAGNHSLRYAYQCSRTFFFGSGPVTYYYDESTEGWVLDSDAVCALVEPGFTVVDTLPPTIDSCAPSCSKDDDPIELSALPGTSASVVVGFSDPSSSEPVNTGGTGVLSEIITNSQFKYTMTAPASANPGDTFLGLITVTDQSDSNNSTLVNFRLTVLDPDTASPVIETCIPTCMNQEPIELVAIAGASASSTVGFSDASQTILTNTGGTGVLSDVTPNHQFTFTLTASASASVGDTFLGEVTITDQSLNNNYKIVGFRLTVIAPDTEDPTIDTCSPGCDGGDDPIELAALPGADDSVTIGFSDASETILSNTGATGVLSDIVANRQFKFTMTAPASSNVGDTFLGEVTITDQSNSNNSITVNFRLTVLGVTDTVGPTFNPSVITLEAQRGESASGSVTISDASDIASISASGGDVTNSGGGSISFPLSSGSSLIYTLAVPANAVVGSTITDLITATDVEGNSSTLSVSLEVLPDDPADPPTVDLSSVSQISSAGRTITQEIVVTDSLASTISLSGPSHSDSTSSVTPSSLPAGGGSFTYSLTIPEGVLNGDVITDSISVTNSGQGSTVIPVSVTISGFSSLPSLTDNERDFASALDAACEALSASVSQSVGEANLEQYCSLLAQADTATQISAIQQATPMQVPAQGSSSIEVAMAQSANVYARIVALRGGARGFSVSGLNFQYQGLSIPASALSADLGRQSGGSAGEENGNLFGKWGVFVNGNISFGDKDASTNTLALDFKTKGLTAGADYRFTDELIAGGAIGFARSDTDFDASRGSIDMSGYSLSAYSTYYHSETTYFDAIASYGRNSFDNRRRLTAFGTVLSEASGSTDGNQFTLSLGGGYDFNRASMQLSSFARINYVNADIDGYSEDTLTGLELSYGDQNVESLATQFGGQVSYAISTSSGVFIPQARFEWVHEFKDDTRAINAQFLYDPSDTGFQFKTDNPDRNYFNLGLGVSATFAEGKSGFIFYEATLGQENVEQHSISAGVRIDF